MSIKHSDKSVYQQYWTDEPKASEQNRLAVSQAIHAEVDARMAFIEAKYQEIFIPTWNDEEAKEAWFRLCLSTPDEGYN